MAVRPNILPLLVLVILLFSTPKPIAGLQMLIGFGERKCFSEDVQSDCPVHIDFRASGGTTDMFVDLFVTNAAGRVVFHKSGLSHHRATLPAFEERMSGDASSAPARVPNFTTLRFCLMHQVLPAQVNPKVERRIAFDIRSAPSERNKRDVAKVNDVHRASLQVRDVEQNILGLLDKMDILKEEERILTVRNEKTSSFLTTISSITTLLVVAIGFLQLEFVQGVLKGKKLIP